MFRLSAVAIGCFATLCPQHLGTSSARADDAEYSAEELVAALVDQLTSIETLDCNFTIHYGEGGEPVRCRLARTETKWHYTELSYDDERAANREYTFCCDNEFVYAFDLWKKKGQAVEWGGVHIQDSRSQENLDPTCMLGLKLSNIERSVIDVLQTANVSSALERTGDGNIRYRLLASGVPAKRVESKIIYYDLQIVLDKSHGLLPCEILITQSPENATWPEWAHHWRVAAFQEVADQVTGENRWFPKSGTLTQGKTGAPTIYIDVGKVEINRSLPASLFRPDVPKGAILADDTSTGRGRLAIEGGEFMIDGRVDELVNHSRQALGRTRISLIIANVTVVAVIVSLILWRRRRFLTFRTHNI